MHAEVKGTCEVGQKCNEYVCLVLHSPHDTQEGGGPREVKCDYVRIWSTAGTSAEFHHQALRDIHDRYKLILPDLDEIHVWSDGHTSTYKGSPNFGRMAAWPKERGVKIIQNFFVEYHACGPQDNAGKGPRIAMEQAIGFGNAPNLYNYHECYKWCCRYLPHPSISHAHTGTWGCNGEYVWWSYANGESDPYRSDATQTLDLRHREYPAVVGSSFKYSFSALSLNAQIESRLMPCFCLKCRNAEFNRCRFRHLWRMKTDTCNLKRILSIHATKERSKKARDDAKERQKRRAERLSGSS